MKNNDIVVDIPEYKSVYIYSLEEPQDIAYLKKECFKYQKRLPYEIQELRDRTVKIINTSYSGIIQLDSTRLHFSTKVKSNLFYMLSFLKDEKHFLYDPEVIIDLQAGESFFDILGRLFLNELQSIYDKGFYKTYVRKEENLGFLKSKLLIRNQLKNHMHKNAKFNCSYEDLTYDNMENRIILKATVLLSPLIRFNEDIKSELLRYSTMMREEVTLAPISPEDCGKVHFGRLNEHYEPIIRFSKLIFQNHFIRYIHKGASQGFNFVVNMNQVYEDFITEIIKEAVREDDRLKDFIVLTQDRCDSLVKEKNRIITKPDILLKRKNTKRDIPLIIDAKYKRQESNLDYYQVIAYALAIPSVKACCLIYPSDEEVDSTILTIDSKKFGNEREDIKLFTKKVNLLWEDNLSFRDFMNKAKSDVTNNLIECLCLE